MDRGAKNAEAAPWCHPCPTIPRLITALAEVWVGWGKQAIWPTGRNTWPAAHSVVFACLQLRRNRQLCSMSGRPDCLPPPLTPAPLPPPVDAAAAVKQGKAVAGHGWHHAVATGRSALAVQPGPPALPHILQAKTGDGTLARNDGAFYPSLQKKGGGEKRTAVTRGLPLRWLLPGFARGYPAQKEGFVSCRFVPTLSSPLNLTILLGG